MTSRFKCPHCNGSGTIEAPLEQLREGFSRFWQAYPIKANEVAAKREWLMILPSNEVIIEMLDALKWQKESEHFGDYWPHAKTYLKDRRWEDVPRDEQTLTEWLKE